MNRALSTREKALLLILAVLLIIIGYIKCVYQPLHDEIDAYHSAAAQEQTELTADAIRLAQMHKMQDALNELKGNGSANAIPSYDNSSALIRALDPILAKSIEYQVDFSEKTTQEGYIILRPATVSFKTSNYSDARAIINALDRIDYMGQISDLDIMTKPEVPVTETTLKITYFEIAP